MKHCFKSVKSSELRVKFLKYSRKYDDDSYIELRLASTCIENKGMCKLSE